MGQNELPSPISQGRQSRHNAIKYSICITNYNTADTIERAISSILSQIDDTYEIVIVDSKSTDESPILAEEFIRKSDIKFKIISKKCSRGRGRQLALENSTGEYILAQIDMDDVLAPRAISSAVNLYHKYYEGMYAWFHGLSICTRDLLKEVGGWEDLQWREDRLLWFRMAQINKLVLVPFELRTYVDPSGTRLGKRSMQERIKNAYITFRDGYRLRQNLLSQQPMSLKWFAMVPLASAAYIRSLTMRRFEGIPLDLWEWAAPYMRKEHIAELKTLLRG
jgi:glycosyltransferase involved in cell wall biosynthesis